MRFGITMKNSLIFTTMLATFLLLLTIVSAVQVAFEKTAVGRIVGDTPEEILSQLKMGDLTLRHSTFYPDHYNITPNQDDPRESEKKLLENYFGENAENYGNWFWWYHPLLGGTVVSDMSNFQKNEFLIIQADGTINNGVLETTKPYSQVYSYFVKFTPSDASEWKYDFKRTNPLFMFDSDYAGLYLPKYFEKGSSYVGMLGQDSTILAPTAIPDREFVRAFICYMGWDKLKYGSPTIGEIFKDARNAYYWQSNKPSGLALMSYELYGSPELKVNIPNANQEIIKEYCDPYIQESDSIIKSSQMSSAGPEIETLGIVYTLESPSSSPNYTIENDFTIENYTLEKIIITNETNFTVIYIEGMPFEKSVNELMLPLKTDIEEFPLRTVIYNVSLLYFDNPVNLTIEDYPMWNGTYIVEKDCLYDKRQAGIMYSHAFTEDSELVLTTISPVEVINCTEGRFRLYRDIRYSIEYMPFSSIHIKSIDYPQEVLPNEEITINATLRNLRNTDVSGSLKIIANNVTLAEIPVNLTGSEVKTFEMTFTTDKDIEKYSLEYWEDSEMKTSKMFKSITKVIDVGLESQEYVAYGLSTYPNILINNRMPNNLTIQINFSLMDSNDTNYKPFTIPLSLNPGLNNKIFKIETNDISVGTYTLMFKFIHEYGEELLSKQMKIVDIQYVNVSGDIDYEPILEINENIEVNEGDVVTLVLKAFDIGGENITISISDPVGNDGIWYTDYNDAGTYSVNVTVNDSRYQVTRTSTIIVNDVNRLPVVEFIDDIFVEEGDLAIIEINAVDYDNDTLSYNVNDTRFTSNLITLTTLSDGSTSKDLAFTTSESKVVYLTLPKNVIVTNAAMDLTGLSNPSAEGSFIIVGSSNYKHQWACGAVVNNKLYIMEGLNSSSGPGNREEHLEEYDPSTDTWTVKADSPYNDRYCTAAAVGDNIYRIGGENNPTAIRKYNIFSNTWSAPLASPPENIEQAGACTYDDAIIVLNGINNHTLIYNTTSNSWLNLANWPSQNNRRYATDCVRVGNLIYSVTPTPAGPGNPASYLMIYYLASNTWTRNISVTSPASGRYGFDLEVMGDILYIIGGNGGIGSDALETVLRVNLADHSLISNAANMNYERGGINGGHAGVINNKIYVACSRDFWGNYLTSTEEYSQEYPTNPYLDVSGDGDTEWSYSGEFMVTERTSDFSQEINDYLLNCTPDTEGYCDIPLVLYSNTAGKIEISNIDVNYVMPSFTSSGIEFIWQTELGDVGNDSVEVNVADGKGEISQIVDITVHEYKNRPPHMSFIDDIIVNETELVWIRPNASDKEGDPITFYFTAPLNESGMWQTDYDSAGEYIVIVTASDGINNVSQSVNITVINIEPPTTTTTTTTTTSTTTTTTSSTTTSTTTTSTTTTTIPTISYPRWSLNSTNSTYAGSAIEHRLKWEDDEGLSGYVFSLKEGDEVCQTIQLQDANTENLDDSNVRHSSPDYNSGSSSVLDVWRNQGFSHNYTKRTYIKFNISSIPSDSIIQDASLYLWLFDSSSSTGYEVDVHHVYKHTWREETITWNNQPCGGWDFDNSSNCNVSYAEDVTTVYGDINDGDMWISWDVTNAVVNETSDHNENVSFVIKFHNEESFGTIWKDFRSKEYSNVTLRPYLNITYCTDWQDDPWQPMSGTGDWSNVIKVITPDVGKTIRWKVYANDTDNNWNVSDEFSYVTTDGSVCIGDVDGIPIDGIRTVGILDLIIVGNAYGSTPTSPNWDARADLKPDNIINIFDLSIVGKNYGKEC